MKITIEDVKKKYRFTEEDLKRADINAIKSLIKTNMKRQDEYNRFFGHDNIEECQAYENGIK